MWKRNIVSKAHVYDERYPDFSCFLSSFSLLNRSGPSYFKLEHPMMTTIASAVSAKANFHNLSQYGHTHDSCKAVSYARLITASAPCTHMTPWNTCSHLTRFLACSCTSVSIYLNLISEARLLEYVVAASYMQHRITSSVEIVPDNRNVCNTLKSRRIEITTSSPRLPAL